MWNKTCKIKLSVKEETVKTLSKISQLTVE